eukprot:CAMPEP_0176124520 /NCGR_PEP_ID=MMETSP0120_2-20121206/62785_1 /TAXON_ID=160619 /ORGANISM="Kryptoperidinium foliaceum, Strain CCMP 1326" /LENGTH=62 /DNA_ID=CAMNT_0017459303 /DNA_START=1 /DNA_END=186 /DNA_ORIENTATION=+
MTSRIQGATVSSVTRSDGLNLASNRCLQTMPPSLQPRMHPIRDVGHGMAAFRRGAKHGSNTN